MPEYIVDGSFITYAPDEDRPKGQRTWYEIDDPKYRDWDAPIENFVEPKTSWYHLMKYKDLRPSAYLMPFNKIFEEKMSPEAEINLIPDDEFIDYISQNFWITEDEEVYQRVLSAETREDLIKLDSAILAGKYDREPNQDAFWGFSLIFLGAFLISLSIKKYATFKTEAQTKKRKMHLAGSSFDLRYSMWKICWKEVRKVLQKPTKK